MLWSTIKSCAPKALKEAFFWLLTNLNCDDGKEQYLDLMIGVCIASKVGVFCSGIGENATLSSWTLKLTESWASQKLIQAAISWQLMKRERKVKLFINSTDHIKIWAWCSLLIGQLIPLVICESYAVWDRVKAEPALSGAFPWSCTRYSHVMCAFKRTLNLATSQLHNMV